MLNILIKIITVFIISLSTFFCYAQKKDLTEEQYFKNNFKEIIQPLPAITKWMDDKHFIILKNNKSYIVDCKNGAEKEYAVSPYKAVEFTDPRITIKGTDIFLTTNKADVQLTNDKEKENNAMLSPDGNYVAFTKKQ
jgi:dipeptidyl-peptidase-4